MKFTLSWLKKHLDTTASLDEITTKLTMIGLEVEGVEDKFAALTPFTVAYVKEAKQHPNADRLRVCQLETKFGDVQVVCGAPNARTGMKAIFAPDGSTIPASGTVLKAGEIRGEKSNGMMVSEREMGLSDEHTGIIEVPDHFAIGTPLPEVLGGNDPVIEIKLTPNRADCAGVRGIARDLTAVGVGTLKPLPVEPVKGSFASPLSVKIENLEACPHFVGRTIKGVKNGPSPKWLQDALRAVGLRPISALVDITNYFTIDLCRPLHVFDVAKVKGNTLTVGLSKGGEVLPALNDKTYTLSEDMTVISDASGVEALGGVMGGSVTGCSEETTEVFLEVALFDPIRTARTGRLLSLITDARYRFERGVDYANLRDMAELATRMILDLCGGEASELVEAGAAPAWQRSYAFNPSRCLTLGGVDVPSDEQKEILTRLGFAIKDGMAVVPSWRPDVQDSADLVEEVLRIKGFDCIPALPMPRVSEAAVTSLSPYQRKVAQTRRALAARGLMEAVTYSFISREEAALFGGNDPQLEIVNPISAEMAVMRPSGLPTLIKAVSGNAARGYPDVGLFEIGPLFSGKETNSEAQVIAMLRSGLAVGRSVYKAERAVDAFDAKADALAALEMLGVPTAGLQVTADAPAWYHPGRSGCLRLGPNVIAQFGEIHPDILAVFGIKMAVVAAEVLLAKIPPIKAPKSAAKPLLKLAAFQPLERDFAFVVSNDVTAEKILKAVRGAEKDLIVSARVFDEYKGQGLPEGKKSLALSITIQPLEKTFTEAEIESVAKKVTAAVEKAVGGVLRA